MEKMINVEIMFAFCWHILKGTNVCFICSFFCVKKNHVFVLQLLLGIVDSDLLFRNKIQLSNVSHRILTASLSLKAWPDC